MSVYETEGQKEFLTICPRDEVYMNYNMSPVKLRIIKDPGVDMVPDFDIVVNDLASGRKHFQNNSGKGDTFKVDVLVGADDKVMSRKDFTDWSWQDALDDYDTILSIHSVGIKGAGGTSSASLAKHFPLVEVLDYWIRSLTPLNVVSNAIDIANGLYIVTGNSSRKQTYDKFSVWELEFMKYESISSTVLFKSSTKVADSAIKKYNNAKKKKAATAKAKAEAKKKTTAKYKLQHSCKASNLKYSKEKKVVTCVKYMQKILINKKCLVNSSSNRDGWYGPVTKAAVKAFQKKYASKYSLKQTGNVDANTFKALYSA